MSDLRELEYGTSHLLGDVAHVRYTTTINALATPLPLPRRATCNKRLATRELCQPTAPLPKLKLLLHPYMRYKWHAPQL